MESTPAPSSVNAKIPNLLFHPQHGLCVERENLPLLKVPDNDFGRWFLRSRFEHMNATPEALEWFRRNDPAAMVSIPGLILTPRTYQLLALFRMRIGSYCLWFDMGLGKTFITIAYCLQHPGNLFIILCPLSVFVTWLDEIKKHVSIDVDVFFAHGSKKNKVLAELRAKPRKKKTFVITTYDTLKGIIDVVLDLKLDAIFMDEASEVKTMTAARTEAAHALVNGWVENNRFVESPFKNTPRFLLSGTPSTNKVSGYYSLYELIYRGATGCQNLFIFKQHYTELKKFMIIENFSIEGQKRVTHLFAENAQKWLENNNPPGEQQSYKALGYTFEERPRADGKYIKVIRTYNKETNVKNIAQLNKLTQTLAYTLTKEEVFKELPGKIFMRREIAMSEEQAKAYEELLTQNSTTLENQPFTFFGQTPHMKLHQIANGYLITPDRSVYYFKTQPKIDEALRIIEEAGKQKIIIWSPWVPQIKKTSETLTKEEIGHVLLYGATTPDARIEAVRKFQHDPDCNVLLSNQSVGGLGLNLAFGWLQIFMANWHEADIRDQAIDRQHRFGQQHCVTVMDLVSKDTLEPTVLANCERKTKIEGRILSMKELGA